MTDPGSGVRGLIVQPVHSPAYADIDEWPMAARDIELAAIADALRRGYSVFLSGEAGAGKTRLLVTALDRAATAGASVARVGPAHEHTTPPSRALHDWIDTRPDGLIVLGADDAHLLDPSSAGILRHLAASDRVAVIACVRSDERAPDEITRLWVDRLADRIDVARFDPFAVAVVLKAWLGGRADVTTVNSLHSVTLGNPLLLRELVDHALAEGSLHHDRGLWRWSGLTGADGRLLDLVRLRLGDLDDDEWELVNMVALADSIEAGLPPLVELTSAAESLNRSGILVVEGAGQRLRLAYPLYGEVIVATMPELTARRLRLRLAGAGGSAPVPPRRETADGWAAHSTLTSRERDVAALAAIGLSNREIAARLVVSVRTVENHLQRTYTKLGISTRAELATTPIS